MIEFRKCGEWLEVLVDKKTVAELYAKHGQNPGDVFLKIKNELERGGKICWPD